MNLTESYWTLLNLTEPSWAMSSHNGRTNFSLDLSLLHYVRHQGRTFPEMYEPIEVHLQKINNMNLRSDDVILYSYPKSGTESQPLYTNRKELLY